MHRYIFLVLALVAVVMLAGCDSGSNEGTTYTYLAKYTTATNSYSIVRVDGAAEQSVLAATGRLTDFVFDGPTVAPPAQAADWCYYSNSQDGAKIWRADGTSVFTHTTFLRDLAVKDGVLYFSESYGAGQDGKIYQLSNTGVASLFYTVAIAKVGFWAGNFAFSPDGTLYIANGNISGASIYRCPIGGAPTSAFHRTDGGSVLGFGFSTDDTLLFTDGSRVVREAHTGNTAMTTFFTGPAGASYTDVVVGTKLFPVAP
jgi:hypothetical protein